jgi:hypothetical protein
VTNLRSRQTYADSSWDWTFLNECFAPTHIRVSDVDGIVERRGHFLWIETKFPGEKVEEGQRIMHDAALATGRFSVMVVWGEPNAPVRYSLRGPNVDEDRFVIGESEIVGLVRRWFLWADGQHG